MNKWIIGSCLLLWCVLACVGNENQSGIDPKLLDSLEQACKMDPQNKFIQNSLNQNDATKLIPDWQKINGVDPYFSNKLKGQKITEQKSTGRCWMFAGLNILRPTAAKFLNMEDFEFSENYLFFYDKLEKANMFLQAIVKTKDNPLSDRTLEFLLKDPVPDGGQWVGLVELIRKYGAVPKEVMPETQSSSNSRTLNHTLALKLKEYALLLRREKNDKNIEALRFQALKDIYRILALNLGIPPKTFKWRYENKDKKLVTTKEYSPQQFYKETVNMDLDNYFALYSIPNRPFEKLYEIDLDKSIYDRPNMVFANCALETLKEMAQKCLLDNQPVWFACDVGSDSFGDRGLLMPAIYDYASLYQMEFKLTRQDLFETYSTSPNHAMVLTGMDMENNKVRKWQVENSWGEKFGNKGYYTMLDEWFDFYVQCIVIHKKYISQKILDIFKTQAEILPPWDPMYRAVTMD